jgi:hypothetical protein
MFESVPYVLSMQQKRVTKAHSKMLQKRSKKSPKLMRDRSKIFKMLKRRKEHSKMYQIDRRNAKV